MTENSVCMATYNGTQYLSEQVASILAQLGVDDELVVVDDASSDGTVALLESMSDPRIRLVQNPQNLGVNSTFERAISLAQGKVIFLSDQDDIWRPGRLAQMRAALVDADAGLVVSNYGLIDQDGAALDQHLMTPLRASDGPRRAANFLGILAGKRNYYGCAMCFTAAFAQRALPFPKPMECHDLWLAICANADGALVHLEQDTLAHRVHGSNASIISRSVMAKLNARLELLALIWKASYKRVILSADQ